MGYATEKRFKTSVFGPNKKKQVSEFLVSFRQSVRAAWADAQLHIHLGDVRTFPRIIATFESCVFDFI